MAISAEAKGRTLRAGGLLLCLGAFFHRAIFSSDIFIARDIFRVYYPLRSFWVEQVAAGSFPAWYPYDALGQPYVGMVVSAAFHPANLLYLAFPLGLALKLNVLACYPIAFYGAYALAKRWGCARLGATVAGVLFAFNGYSLGITNNLAYLMALATVPWALWAFDRLLEAPSILRAGVAGALLSAVLYAGDAQCFVVTAGLCCLVPLGRHRRGAALREAWVTGGALLLALLFSAAQLLPSAAAATEGAAASRTLGNALSWSLHPLLLLEMIFGPLFGGSAANEGARLVASTLLHQGMQSLWVDTIHLGAPAVVLAALGVAVRRRSWGAKVAGAAFLLLFLLTLGRYGGLYRIFHEWLPFWGPFRYPMKLLPFALLGLALAAGAGTDAANDPARRQRLGVALLGVAALSGVLALAEATLRPFSAGLFPALWPDALPAALDELQGALLRGCVETLGACLLMAIAMSRPTNPWRGAVLVPAILALHLLVANEPVFALATPELVSTPPPFADEIRAREGTPRLGGYRVADLVPLASDVTLEGLSKEESLAVSRSIVLSAASPALFGLEGANNYLPAGSARYDELARDHLRWFSRYSALFSGRYLTLPTRTYRALGGRGLSVVAEDRRFQVVLVKNDSALARSYLARPICVADRAAAKAALSAAAPSPPGSAIIECGGTLPDVAEGPGAPGEAEVVAYRPSEIELRVDAVAHSVVVLNDAFYSGWSATVDGAAAPILPANYAARAVAVPPGVHTVRFSYRAPGLLPGVLISVVTLVLTILGGVLARRSEVHTGRGTQWLRVL